MTAYIPLTQGQLAIVDLDDVPLLLDYTWQARKDRSGGFYATSKNNIRMHRLLCEGETVDHQNHNTLDNTRKNLRYVTPQQSMLNRRRKNDCGYKGVSFTRGRYQARLSVDGTNVHIGMFATAEEAARAYDAAMLEWAGPYACLNFPQGETK